MLVLWVVLVILPFPNTMWVTSPVDLFIPLLSTVDCRSRVASAPESRRAVSTMPVAATTGASSPSQSHSSRVSSGGPDLTCSLMDCALITETLLVPSNLPPLPLELAPEFWVLCPPFNCLADWRAVSMNRGILLMNFIVAG